MPIGARCAAVFVALAWGINMIVAKLSTAEIPPLMLTALRFALVAVLLFPFCRPKRDQLPWLIALSATLGTGHFGLLFLGLSLSEAGTGAILVQLGAPIAVFLGVLLLRERIGISAIIGLMLATAGLVMLACGPNTPPPLPFVILLVSAVSWAVSNTIVRMAPPIRPLEINAVSALFSVPQLLGMSLMIEGNPLEYVGHIGFVGIMGVLYTALVSSVLAYGIWYGLIQTYGVASVINYSLLTPVFATAFGIVLLDEPANPSKIVSGLSIVLGASISMCFSGSRERPVR